ncbi:hypothetical protein OC845_000198 [Tilletia horrida]|nr:hypothetical protein OC845_000198 [Tilletia horrida]
MTSSISAAANGSATAVQPVTNGEDVEYSVRLCLTKEELLEARKLRLEVFWKEQGFPRDTEIDEWEPLSAHFLAWETSKATGQSRVVGTVRWVPYPYPPLDPNFVISQDEPDFPLGSLRDEATVKALFARPLPSSAVENEQGEPEAAETAREIRAVPAMLCGGKLTRLAVAKEARGLRLGEMLVRETEKWVINAVQSGSPKNDGGGAQELHSCKLVLSSQMHAIKFYTRLSYAPVGDVYDEEGAPHLRLEKTVVF